MIGRSLGTIGNCRSPIVCRKDNQGVIPNTSILESLCDIANAFLGVLVKYGIEREGRMGYPIGLGYPPDWGERTASIRTEDKTVLQPGMTFHFMPALWMDTWGLETTETILITDTGPAEALCNMDRKLFVKA